MRLEEQDQQIGGGEEAEEDVVVSRARAMLAEKAETQGQQDGRHRARAQRTGHSVREAHHQRQDAHGRQAGRRAHAPFRRSKDLHGQRHEPDQQRRLGVPQIRRELIGRHEAQAMQAHLEGVHREA
jgi:hypothetical protein